MSHNEAALGHGHLMANHLTAEECRLAEISPAFSPLLHRRLKAMRLLREGQSITVVAAQLGVSRRAVYDWIARYERYGINGLVDRPRSGRPGIVTPAYMQCLLEALTRLELLPADGWRTKALREYLRQQMGITMSMCRFYRLLRSLGYSFHAVRLYRGNLRVFSGYTWIRAEGLRYEGITVFLRCEVTSYQDLTVRPIPRGRRHILRVFAIRRLVRHVPIAVSRRSKTPGERRLEQVFEAIQKRRRDAALAEKDSYNKLLRSMRRRPKSQARS